MRQDHVGEKGCLVVITKQYLSEHLDLQGTFLAEFSLKIRQSENTDMLSLKAIKNVHGCQPWGLLSAFHIR